MLLFATYMDTINFSRHDSSIVIAVIATLHIQYILFKMLPKNSCFREMGKKSVFYLFMVPKARSCLVKCSLNVLVIVLAALVFIVLFYQARYCERIVVSHEILVKPKESVEDSSSSSLFGCDLFSGKWVYDNESYPLYRDRDCKFMVDDLACEKYGRKDLEYQHWRWQPHGCDLPRFNASMFLEKLRGKRLVYVGDSLNRNQWVSMVCMVESSIPKEFKYLRLNGSLYSFKATEYEVSIEFYWSPLLVESNADNSSNHRVSDRIVRTKSIEKHAQHWGDADLLIFNSYQWWRQPTLKLLHGTFERHNDQDLTDVPSSKLYKMALRTWSNWLSRNLKSEKTRLFFISPSATHSRGEDWGMPMNQNCFNETEPIFRNRFHGSSSDPKTMRITERAISRLKGRGLKIQMINITQLTEYRKDGHPSTYKKQYHPLSKQQLSDPRYYADCTHWCLPGVPDVWNELLFADLLYL